MKKSTCWLERFLSRENCVIVIQLVMKSLNSLQSEYINIDSCCLEQDGKGMGSYYLFNFRVIKTGFLRDLTSNRKYYSDSN